MPVTNQSQNYIKDILSMKNHSILFAKELFIIGIIHWISTSFNYMRKIKLDGNTVDYRSMALFSS